METRQKRQKLAPYVRFTHFNVANGQATVAGVSDGERFYYGVSLCNPGDQFNRAEGRHRAMRRMFTQDKDFSGVIDKIEPNMTVGDLSLLGLNRTLDRAAECITSPTNRSKHFNEWGEPSWYMSADYEDITFRTRKRNKLSEEK